MADNGSDRKKIRGKFKVSLPELRQMFIPIPVDRMDSRGMSEEERKKQREADNKRSSHNSHLQKAINEAVLEERYAYNLNRKAVLLEKLEKLRNAVVKP
jgi:hypothetical protein